MIDKTELKAKIKQYLNTLDNEKKDEIYTTQRKLAEGELNEFLDYVFSPNKCCEKAAMAIEIREGKFYMKGTNIEIKYCPYCGKELVIKED